VWSQQITPNATTSKIVLSGKFVVSADNNNRTVIAMIFRGSVCVGVASQAIITAGTIMTMGFQIFDSPSTLSPTTYTIRCASAGGATTWYVGQANIPLFNGMLASNGISVSEIA
jgi:hypothetical protein